MERTPLIADRTADSIMHPDIRPFAPFSDSKPMLLAVTVPILHWSCLAAGLAGVCVLAIQNLIRKAEA